MSGTIHEPMHSAIKLDTELHETASLLRLAESTGVAMEAIGVNTLGLWLRIEETRETVERMGRR